MIGRLRQLSEPRLRQQAGIEKSQTPVERDILVQLVRKNHLRLRHSTIFHAEFFSCFFSVACGCCGGCDCDDMCPCNPTRFSVYDVLSSGIFRRDICSVTPDCCPGKIRVRTRYSYATEN